MTGPASNQDAVTASLRELIGNTPRFNPMALMREIDAAMRRQGFTTTVASAVGVRVSADSSVVGAGTALEFTAQRAQAEIGVTAFQLGGNVNVSASTSDVKINGEVAASIPLARGRFGLEAAWKPNKVEQLSTGGSRVSDMTVEIIVPAGASLPYWWGGVNVGPYWKVSLQLQQRDPLYETQFKGAVETYLRNNEAFLSAVSQRGQSVDNVLSRLHQFNLGTDIDFRIGTAAFLAKELQLTRFEGLPTVHLRGRDGTQGAILTETDWARNRTTVEIIQVNGQNHYVVSDQYAQRAPNDQVDLYRRGEQLSSDLKGLPDEQFSELRTTHDVFGNIVPGDLKNRTHELNGLAIAPTSGTEPMVFAADVEALWREYLFTDPSLRPQIRGVEGPGGIAIPKLVTSTVNPTGAVQREKALGGKEIVVTGIRRPSDGKVASLTISRAGGPTTAELNRAELERLGLASNVDRWAQPAASPSTWSNLSDDLRRARITALETNASQLSIEPLDTGGFDLIVANDDAWKSVRWDAVDVPMERVRADNFGLDKVGDQTTVYLPKSVLGVNFAEAGSILGSTFGRVLAGNDKLAGVVASTTLQAFGASLGRSLDGVMSGRGLSQAMGDAFADLPLDFRNGGVAAISSIVTAEFVNALGLRGFAGDLANTVVGGTINQIAINLLDNARLNLVGADANPLRGLDGGSLAQIGTAAAAMMGSRLASELVSFQTLGGQYGSSLGSSLMAIAGKKVLGPIFTKAFASLGTFAGPLGTAAGALVGAFVGFIVGGVIGSLFGGTPRSGADVVWDGESGTFEAANAWSRKGGSRDAAVSFAEAVATTFNNVLASTGGRLAAPEAVQTGNYGMRKSEFVYQPNTGRRDQDNITARFRGPNAAEQLINHGVRMGLTDADFQIVGGDMYAKRALYNGVQLAGTGLTMQSLLGDMAFAKQFRTYLENSVAIKALIAAEPDSVFAAEWALVLTRSMELGLHKRHASDWYGGWGLMLEDLGVLPMDAQLGLQYDPASGQFERIIGIGMSSMLDTIDTPGKDFIVGTGGNDTIVINGDQLAAESGAAGQVGSVNAGLTVNDAAHAGTALKIDVAATIDAGGGDDTVRGGDLGNELFGGTGNDTLIGGRLDDWLFGGSGNDVLYAGSVANDQLDNVDVALAAEGGSGNYLDGGAGDDRLFGSTGSDWLAGGEGADQLHGGAGGDILDAGQGDDGSDAAPAVRGGAGSDQYVFRRGDGRDVLFDSDGGAPGASAATGDSISVYSQNRTGSRNWAGNGDFSVDGSVKGGEDALVFGPGITMADLLLIRSGTADAPGMDLIVRVQRTEPDGRQVWNPGDDEIVIRDWFEGTRRIEWFRFGNGEDLRVADFTTIQRGTAGADVIVGTAGKDWLYGGDGDDNMFGLANNDWVIGGRGNDLVSGNDDEDYVIGGEHDDVALGGNGRDVVTGDNGNDRVYGGSGDDVVSGGRGDDEVSTGAGSDVVRFERGDGRDTLMDDYSNTWEVVWQSATAAAGSSNTGASGYTNGYVLGTDGKVRKGSDVVFDGTRWTGFYDYNEAGGVRTLLRWKEPSTGPRTRNVAGDTDTLEFGVGIDIQDLVLEQAGDDLKIAVLRSGGSIDRFDEVADQVRIRDWFSSNTDVRRSIEQFRFVETGVHDLTAGADGMDIVARQGSSDGADTLTGNAGRRNWITGGAGDDILTGAGLADILSGNSGADALDGAAGDDVLYGGDGDDVLTGGAGLDRLYGGAGIDTASYAGAISGVTIFLGGPPEASNWGGMGADTFFSIENLIGSDHGDTLHGDAGANVLDGGRGADTLHGYEGDDVYVFTPGSGTTTLAMGADLIIDASGNDMIEITGANISLSNLNFTRQNSNRDLRIAQGATGMTGNHFTIRDHFFSPAAMVEALQFADGFTVQLARPTAPGANTMTSALILVAAGGTGNGTAENDVMIGGSTTGTGIETLNGLAGDDVLSAGGGADRLNGGDGDDALEGGAGGDILDGGSDSVTAGGQAGPGRGDTIRYVASTNPVNVDLSSDGLFSGGEAQGDRVIWDNGAATVENVVGSATFGDILVGDGRHNILSGLGGSDVLRGLGGDDVLLGGDGEDEAHGGDGADNIDGGAGNDRWIFGDAGNDFIAGGAGDDILDGGVDDDQLDGGTGNDTLHGRTGRDALGGGDGTDTLHGHEDDDRLAGGADNDTLHGGAGNDTLAGEAGDDQLRGEAGDDSYVFDANSGQDTLIDAEGANRIVFSDVSSDRIWMRRDGDNLVVEVIGSSTRVTASNFFAATGRTQLREIATADASLFLKYAGGQTYGGSLIEAMTSASAASGGRLPAHVGAIPSAVTALQARHWWPGGKAAPQAVGGTLATDEDVALAGTLAVVDHDETIPATGAFSVASQGRLGSVSIDANTGAYVYTPRANVHGQDSFALQVRDADGQVSTATFEVTVRSVNDAPHDVLLAQAAPVVERDRPMEGTHRPPVRVGVLSALDVDAPDPGDFDDHRFTTTDGRFEIVGTELFLRDGQSFDFENAVVVDGRRFVSVSVTATDRNGAGLSLTKSLMVEVGDAIDHLYGTPGHDQGASALVGQAGRDVIDGRAGNDHVSGLAGDDQLRGGDGGDQLFGNEGDDELHGDTGNDTLEGGTGRDRLFGGFGVDTLRGGDEDDELRGNADADWLHGDGGSDVLDGAEGNDTLFGGAGLDELRGGAGNDVLLGGLDGDRLIGGDGTDTASYLELASGVAATQGVTVDLADSARNRGVAAGDTYDGIENVRGTNHVDDISGNAADNELIGNGGNDALRGRAGDDTLLGGLGTDQLFGDDGHDTLRGEAGTDTLSGGGGNDLLFGDDGNDTLNGNDGDDQLAGGTGNDLLVGGAGHDVFFFFRRDGDDTIDQAGALATDRDQLGFTFEAGHATRTQINNDALWFRRDGSDVVITVLGTAGSDGSVRLRSFLSNDVDGRAQVQSFIAGHQRTKHLQVRTLAELMDAVAAARGRMPANVTEMTTWRNDATLLVTLGGETRSFGQHWTALWSENEAPILTAVPAAQNWQEDQHNGAGAVLAFTVADDATLTQNLPITVREVSGHGRTDEVAAEDRLFDSITVSRPTASSVVNGLETGSGSITVRTRPDASGERWLWIRAEDAGGLSVDQWVRVTATAVADTPVVNVTDTRGQGDGTPIPLNISAQVTDTDGSEVIDRVEISNVPGEVTFTSTTGGVSADNNRRPDGVWQFTPTEVQGLQLVARPNEHAASPDLAGTRALRVTAVAREQSNGSTAISSPANLSVVLNARPTGLIAALSVPEMTAPGTIVGVAAGVDTDRFENSRIPASAWGSNAALTSRGWSTQATSEMQWIEAPGPFGPQTTVMRTGSFDADRDGGGVGLSELVAVDPNRAYRFSIFVRPETTDKHHIYFGPNGRHDSSGAMKHGWDSTDTSDPYFVAGLARDMNMQAGRWYRIDGYVLPHDHAAVPNGLFGGVFDVASGDKVADVSTFRWRESIPGNQALLRYFNIVDAVPPLSAQQWSTQWYLPTIEQLPILRMLDTAGDRFRMDTRSGLVTVGNGPATDFEANSQHGLLIEVADDHGPSSFYGTLANVTDVNERPVVHGVWHGQQPDGSIRYSRNFFPESTAANGFQHVGLADAHFRVTDPDNASDPNRDPLTIHVGNDPFDLFEDTLRVDHHLYYKKNVTADFLRERMGQGGIASAWTDRGDGIMRLKIASLRLHAVDSRGLPAADTFTYDVWIEDANEAPIVQPATFSVSENASVPGMPIGTVTARDPDPSPRFNSVSFTVTSGTDSQLFHFAGGGASGSLISHASYNFEGRSRYDLQISARDNGGQSTSGSVGINVRNMPEAPRPTFQFLDSTVSSATYLIFPNDEDGSSGLTAEASIQNGMPNSSISTVWNLSYNAFQVEVSSAPPAGEFHEGDARVTVRDPDNLSGSVSFSWRINGRPLRPGERPQSGNLIDSSTLPAINGAAPLIVFDLDGDGIELVPVAQSTVRFDMNGDGTVDQTGWIGPDDAMLVIDQDGDGAISGVEEISFGISGSGSRSAVDLLQRFDNDASGWFDAGDRMFPLLRLWQDTNQNGIAETGELTSFTELDIASVPLELSHTGRAVEGATDSVVFASGKANRPSGTMVDTAAVFLAFAGQESAGGMLTPDASTANASLDGTVHNVSGVVAPRGTRFAGVSAEQPLPFALTRAAAAGVLAERAAVEAASGLPSVAELGQLPGALDTEDSSNAVAPATSRRAPASSSDISTPNGPPAPSLSPGSATASSVPGGELELGRSGSEGAGAATAPTTAPKATGTDAAPGPNEVIAATQLLAARQPASWGGDPLARAVALLSSAEPNSLNAAAPAPVVRNGPFAVNATALSANDNSLDRMIAAMAAFQAGQIGASGGRMGASAADTALAQLAPAI